MADGYKVTGMYVGGDKVWPPQKSTFEYTYDFRNKTWNQVQSAGWTLQQGTSWTTINSNGIVCPTIGQGSSCWFMINYPVDFTNATKVVMGMQAYGYAQTWGNATRLRTCQPSDRDGTYGFVVRVGTTTASGYICYDSTWNVDGETRYSSAPVTGTFYREATYDLVNKTISFYREGLSTLTGTFTDTVVQRIRNSTVMSLDGGHDIGTVYIHYVYIKVEY